MEKLKVKVVSALHYLAGPLKNHMGYSPLMVLLRRGGNVVDSRSGSVDSTVANGAKTRDNTVAVVDSGDDSTAGQTVGNLPNGVGVGLSLSPGGSHKKNLRMVMVNERICLLMVNMVS